MKPSVPNITNFFGSKVPKTPVRHVGMAHTASWDNFDGQPFFQPSIAETVFRRYFDEGVRLFPILDARAKITRHMEHTFNIATNWYPSLVVSKAVREVRRGTTSSILVESTEGLMPNMLFVVPPVGELIWIRSIDAEHEITVVRGIGASDPMDIPPNTALQYAGVAVEEGSYRTTGVIQKTASWTVQTMIFRHGWAETNTVSEAINRLGTHTFKDSKEDALKAHAQAIEAAILFSQHGRNVAHGMPLRTAAGIIDFVRHAAPQNMITVATAVDKDDLDRIFDAAGDVVLTGSTSRDRICYCDSAFARTINEVGRMMENPFFSGITRETSTLTSTKYTDVETDKLTVTVDTHPLISRMSAVSGNQLGLGLVIDPNQFEIRYLGSRRFQTTYFNTDGSGRTATIENDNGVDAKGGSIISELMLINKNPATSALIYNMTKASAPKFRGCLEICK